MSSETAVIVNITEQNYAAHRTYGTFQVSGRALAVRAMDGQSEDRDQARHSGDVRHGSEARHGEQAYALTRITARTATMDYGDKRVLPLPISAREIADDLCREINSDAGENSFLGVFVCAGAAPTDEELRGAQARLDDFYRSLVAAADREWERSHSFLFINDLQRRAAARLGLDKDWYPHGREMAECPGCGERVKPGVAVCKSCGAILDRDKALALGLARLPEGQAQPFATGASDKTRGQDELGRRSRKVVAEVSGATAQQEA
jgi:hypothetical protein